MNKILTFLKTAYRKTGWPYFNKQDLINAFGEDTSKHLNEMKKQGYIRRREGCNADLVELILPVEK